MTYLQKRKKLLCDRTIDLIALKSLGASSSSGLGTHG